AGSPPSWQSGSGVPPSPSLAGAALCRFSDDALIAMKFCGRCDSCRWVCENHPERPWLGGRACDCGGAGAPCPVCNRIDADDLDDVPRMPGGFVAGVVRKKPD
ncbi:hypothetical protein FXB40_47445, partial [Bradyrhizobium rifense]